jgi:hypothetical protein
MVLDAQKGNEQKEKITRSLATPSTGGTSSPTTGGSIHDEYDEEED